MICTSIEQSRHLLELGLDPKTADMVYLFEDKEYPCVLKEPDYLDGSDTLAWSLSALLEVMRKLHAVVTLQVTELSTWLRIKDLGFIWQKDIQTQNPMDAVYGGMLWLLEQGLIKKGDNNESKD